MQLKIKRIHPDAVLPTYAHSTDSGFDLYALEDVIIEPGQTVRVRTGICVELPPHTEMQIRPRSGISAKTKLRVGNAPGTIDEGYNGEIQVIIDNIAHDKDAWCPWIQHLDGTTKRTEDDEYLEFTYLIRKGDRIAQGVIMPIVRADITEVDELGETERGATGFGHSGMR